MAHKTLIGGTGYEIKGGRTLIGGTGYDIKSGRTLIGGTGYDISFLKLAQFLVIIYPKIYYSFDGASWNSVDIPSWVYTNDYDQRETIYMQRIIWNGSKFVGGHTSSSEYSLHYSVSDDGYNWSSPIAYSTWNLYIYPERAIKAKSGIMLGIMSSSANAFAKSTDGGYTWINFTPQSTRSMTYYDIAMGESKMIAVGSYSGSSSYCYYIYSTDDGSTWAVKQAGTSSNPTYAVCFGNGIFVVVTTQSVIYKILESSIDSPTRIALSGKSGNPARPTDVAYGNGKYVIVCENGYIYYSTDATTWTRLDTFYNNYLWSKIEYGYGKFVVADDYGYVTTSTDGTTWTNPVLLSSGQRSSPRIKVSNGNAN